MRKILTLVALCLTLVASAVPAKPGTLTVKQPDGTTLQVVLHGDENNHYMTTVDGTLIMQSENAQYVYAKIVNGHLQATALKAKNAMQRSLDDKDFLASLQQENAHSKLAKRQNLKVKRINHAPSEFGVSPSLVAKGFAILVNFADKDMTTGTNQSISNLLNQDGYSQNGSVGSAKNYFETASNGQYSPDFEVYGPYTLPKNMSYYGGNDYNGNDKHPDQMIVDACNLADKAGVDFSQFDANNDGYVDNVYIFYAGYGEASGASSNTIWPHAWEIYSSNVTGSITFDGKTLKNYACGSELNGNSGSKLAGCGTFCHEFSHVLGLPDFYETNYGSNADKTPGDWEIMDGGSYNGDGYVPPTYSAYERWFMGWLTPTVVPAAGGTFTLNNIEENNEAYMITYDDNTVASASSASPSHPIYIIENRQAGEWDDYLPNHGMLIWKYTFNRSNWINNRPNNVTPMGMDIMEADGRPGPYSYRGDVFPGTSSPRHTTFTKGYRDITDITESNKVITFTVAGPDGGGDGGDGGTTPTDDNTYVNNCLTENFAKISETRTSNIEAELNNYTDLTGWTGSYVYENTDGIKLGSSKNRGILTTPTFNATGDFTITLNVSNYRTEGNTLMITVVGGGTINNNNNLSVAIDGSKTNTTFTVTGATASTQLKFETVGSDKRFVMYAPFKICKKSPNGVDNTMSEAPVLHNTEDGVMIENLSYNSQITVFDMCGKITQSLSTNDAKVNLSLNTGLHIIKVISNNQITTFKTVSK